MVAQDLKVNVTYGMGATCRARLPRQTAMGLSARQLIDVVSRRVDGNGTEHRVARVLSEVLTRGQGIDIQVSKRPGRPDTQDRPIRPDQPVVTPEDDAGPDVEEIDMHVSEAYVGGSRR